MYYILADNEGNILAQCQMDAAPILYPFESTPARTDADGELGLYKIWKMKVIDGELKWVQVDRPLTVNELHAQQMQDMKNRIASVESEMLEITKAWKPGEAVVVDDERYYNGVWYVCSQAHTTQADWTPDVAVSLWAVK